MESDKKVLVYQDWKTAPFCRGFKYQYFRPAIRYPPDLSVIVDTRKVRMADSPVGERHHHWSDPVSEIGFEFRKSWSSVGNMYVLYASGKLKADVNRITVRMGFLKSNAWWDTREARNLEADAATRIELIQKVIDQLEK